MRLWILKVVAVVSLRLFCYVLMKRIFASTST
jgi:hypothetical protein